MAEIPLLAQLLISKRQRDSQRRREDALLSREDFRWEQEQARRIEQRDYDRERNRLTDERLARMDQQANEDRKFAQQQTQLGIATNPAVQPFGSSMGQGLGAMAADTMLRNSSRVMPSSAQSPTMALGDQLFRVRPQSELDAQDMSRARAKADLDMESKLGMLGELLGAKQTLGIPNSVSVNGISIGGDPRPAAPRQPPVGLAIRGEQSKAYGIVNAALADKDPSKLTKGEWLAIEQSAVAQGANPMDAAEAVAAAQRRYNANDKTSDVEGLNTLFDKLLQLKAMREGKPQ